MKIHVFSMAHNESHLAPYFIRHYRNCFPGCDITIFDNDSTDDTATICKNLGCEVIPIFSDGYVDQLLSDMKNERWKSSQADWIIACDVDEFLQINQVELERLNDSGVTILRTQGFDMVGSDGNPDEITAKYPNDWFSKCICFKRTKIENINYTPGGHHCYPTGLVQWSPSAYALFHYKYLSPSLTLERIKLRCDRTSDDNRKKGIAYEYYEFSEVKVHNEFARVRRKALAWSLLGKFIPKDKYILGHKLISRIP